MAIGHDVLGGKQRHAEQTYGTWTITFTDGVRVDVNRDAAPTPRHAIAMALKEHHGKVKSISYHKT